jgi:hypothetical protein
VGGLGTKTFQGSDGASGSLHFLLSHFITLLHMHPPLEAGQSLCVTCEACIHALEGAQVLHDNVGMIDFFFILSVFFGFCTNQ